jgi:hypothetical protein
MRFLISFEIKTSPRFYDLHLRSRRVTLGGITPYPTEAWITQMARNAVDEMSGGTRGCCYVLHDRDAKFCAAFDEVLASEGIRIYESATKRFHAGARTRCPAQEAHRLGIKKAPLSKPERAGHPTAR